MKNTKSTGIPKHKCVLVSSILGIVPFLLLKRHIRIEKASENNKKD